MRALGTRSKANLNGFCLLRGTRAASRKTSWTFSQLYHHFLEQAPQLVARRVGPRAALKLDTDYEYIRLKAGHDGFCLLRDALGASRKTSSTFSQLYHHFLEQGERGEQTPQLAASDRLPRRNYTRSTKSLV